MDIDQYNSSATKCRHKYTIEYRQRDYGIAYGIADSLGTYA